MLTLKQLEKLSDKRLLTYYKKYSRNAVPKYFDLLDKEGQKEAEETQAYFDKIKEMLDKRGHVQQKFYTHLWLDDVRNPADYGKIKTIHWCKTAAEAIKYIKTGKVEYISFDHDLGTNKTGYDVAKVIEALCYERKIKCPFWEIHSSNPVGRQNIIAAMSKAQKYDGRKIKGHGIYISKR